MWKLPFVAVVTAVKSVLHRIRFGPVDPAWSWRTSTFRDVMAVLTERAIGQPPWLVPFMNRFILSGTPVDLGRVIRRGKDDLDGVPADVLTRPSPDRRTLVFLHGGAYLVGSPRFVRHVASWLTWTLRCRTYALGYRLAPLHPFPAALEDALTAYRCLLDQGQDPRTIVVAGDSAGGGLAVAMTVAARDRGMPLPGALVLLSPWTDLLASGGTMDTNVGVDYLPPVRIRDAVQLVVRDADPADPRVSVINADLTGLPPMLVCVGGNEVLHDSIVAFADKAEACGVDVERVVEPHMFHDWLTVLPNGVSSMLTVERIADFVDRHLDDELSKRDRTPIRLDALG